MQEGTVIQSTKEIQDNSEHKRRLLLETFKERGIIFDLETKKSLMPELVLRLCCEFYKLISQIMQRQVIES